MFSAKRVNTSIIRPDDFLLVWRSGSDSRQSLGFGPGKDKEPRSWLQTPVGFPSVHLYFVFQVRKTPQWWLLWSVPGDSEQCKCNNLRQWSQSLQCAGHSGRSVWCAQVLYGSAARSPESSRAFHPVEQYPRGLEHKPRATLNSSHSSATAEYPFQSAKHTLLQNYLVCAAHGSSDTV